MEQWSNNKSISGLSPGSYSVTISGSFGTTVRNIDLIENQNFPEPFVSTGDLFSNCSPNLETQSFASYQWNFNGQPISTANSQSYLATTPGEYSVTVTNSSQCSATSPVQIYNPSFSLSIVGKNSTCNNRFLGFSQNIITTSWTVPSGATFIKSGNLITVNWGTAISTSGTITCTATNDCGNITTSSILVYPFTAITNSTSTCPGLNIGKANVATLTGGTAPYSYHWSSGTSTTSQLMTNLSAGTYTVTVTDNNNCTTTASTVVNSFPSDMPAPIISGLAYSGAHLYTITNYNSAYDNYYSWNVIPNFGNATISYPNNNKESAIIVWPISGGVIHLTFGLTGCQLNTNFIVSSSYPPLPPNPKHPVEEFIERLSDPSVKSSDFTESADAINSFKLFPNPTTGKISLNYNLLSTENGLIEITNILGVSLYYKKLNPESQQLEIDLSELKPAIYFFKIVVDGKQIHQGKISIIR